MTAHARKVDSLALSAKLRAHAGGRQLLPTAGICSRWRQTGTYASNSPVATGLAVPLQYQSLPLPLRMTQIWEPMHLSINSEGSSWLGLFACGPPLPFAWIMMAAAGWCRYCYCAASACPPLLPPSEARQGLKGVSECALVSK